MRKFIKKSLVAIMTAAMVISSFGATGTKAEAAASGYMLQDKTVQDLMSEYGLIAFNRADIGVHCHSNFLVNTVSMSSNSGLKEEYNTVEDFYFKEAEKLNAQLCEEYFADKDTVHTAAQVIKVNDNQHTVTLKDGTDFIVNRPRTFITDAQIAAAGRYAQYADLADIQKKYIAYNQAIAKQADTTSTDIYNDADMNNRYMTVGSGNNYLTIEYESLVKPTTPIYYDFSNYENDDILVLNIDLKNQTDVYFGVMSLRNNGQSISCAEENFRYKYNRIYYNFYDSSANDKQYTGKITFTAEGFGTIIAPSATVSLSANWDGNVVANNISLTSGQYHRVKGTAIPVVTIDDSDIPGTGTDTPGTGTDTPGTGTDTPGTGTDTPGTGTDTPGTNTPGTNTPGTGTDTSGTGTDTPGTNTPGTGTDTPGTNTPGAGTDTPGTNTPGAGTDTPGTNTPGAGTDTPGTNTPGAGTDTPGTGTDTPGAGTDTPGTGADDKESASSENKGDVSITIKDEETNKPVPGVTVEVTSPDGEKTEYVTDKNGSVEIKDVPAGDYTVTVKKVPFGYNVTIGTKVTVKVTKGKTANKVVTQKTNNKKDLKNAKKALKGAADVKTGDESFDQPLVEQKSEITQVGAKNNNKITTKYNKKLKSYKKKHKKQSKEIAAWITIGGTKIDYPVMYSGLKNNTKYLKKNIDGKKDSHGMLFASYITPKRKITYNNVIFGHNMKDGTMFTDLLKYQNKSFYKNHKYVKLDTQGYNYTYQIVEVIRISCKKGSKDRMILEKFADISNKKVFKQWKKQVTKNREYKCSGKYDRNDTLMILSTCEYEKENGRFVLICKQIKSKKVK